MQECFSCENVALKSSGVSLQSSFSQHDGALESLGVALGCCSDALEYASHKKRSLESLRVSLEFSFPSKKEALESFSFSLELESRNKFCRWNFIPL